MHKSFLIGLAAVATLYTNAAQAQTFKDLVNKANKTLNGGGNNSGSQGGNLSNGEVVSALKQALEIGTKNASGRLNVTNGFFGNQLIKILMPPEARQIETTLRSLGMGAQVDKAILSMNRAAEDASGKAVNIFVNAITSMSIQDGIGILRGGQGAATNFLKNRTTAALTSEFRPVIQNSLNSVGATRYWSDIVNIYNRLPTVRNKVNPDLAGYVTERALNGLFVTIADEENKIRLDPAARVTDLLRKVFGSN
ncbi:hypothetical protein CAP35_02965 [Chitinophagaceae bacterium IBVUCB1]|nr:hypothetical protein CAP35_02965 [Chitinophagaceae bacterium IBVUCB1]